MSLQGPIVTSVMSEPPRGSPLRRSQPEAKATHEVCRRRRRSPCHSHRTALCQLATTVAAVLRSHYVDCFIDRFFRHLGNFFDDASDFGLLLVRKVLIAACELHERPH